MSPTENLTVSDIASMLVASLRKEVLATGRAVIGGQQMRTRSAAMRNKTHHPEIPRNRLTDEALRKSIEDLLSIASDLP